jgi:hypothetical protein
MRENSFLRYSWALALHQVRRLLLPNKVLHPALNCFAILVGACIASSPSVAASQQSPPPGAQLYVIWGHSEAGGHDSGSLESAPTPTHGDHIWALEHNFSQTQNPPPNTFGSRGPSPNTYFADELINEGKATNVVLLKCSGATGQDWRIGIKGAIDSLEKCTQRVKYAVEALKLKLSGGITYCCAGDALEEGKARAFADNYKRLISTFREATGNPSLPFVSAVTPLTESCDKNPSAMEIITLLRSTQEEASVVGATWVDFPSVGLPRSCFHLKGEEQVELGRKMARAMPSIDGRVMVQ